MTHPTPGPWVLATDSDTGHPYSIRTGISPAGKSVLRRDAIARPSTSEGQANARLIVKSPELLEAARLMVAVLGNYQERMGGADRVHDRDGVMLPVGAVRELRKIVQFIEGE